MNTTLLTMLGVILTAGGVGGIVNAVMTDNGFLFPKTESNSSGATILRPGFIGNILIGGIAAVISWGLYGPFSAAIIVVAVGQQLPANNQPGLSLASLVGALLTGVGGARWLSNEVDKNLLRAAATDAAGKPPSPPIAARMAMATPVQVLNLAKGL